MWRNTTPDPTALTRRHAGLEFSGKHKIYKEDETAPLSNIFRKKGVVIIMANKNNKRKSSAFGNRLRKLRRDLDITQEQVAERLNVVRSTYAYYEIGKTFPDYKTIIDIANLFGVTTDFLLGNKGAALLSQGEKPSRDYEAGEAGSVSMHELQLRENERRLVEAFRYLNSADQKQILLTLERMAFKEYSSRKKDTDA